MFQLIPIKSLCRAKADRQEKVNFVLFFSNMLEEVELNQEYKGVTPGPGNSAKSLGD